MLNEGLGAGGLGKGQSVSQGGRGIVPQQKGAHDGF